MTAKLDSVSNQITTARKLLMETATPVNQFQLQQWADTIAAEVAKSAWRPMVLGWKYKTISGEDVVMVSIHNEGTDYETMACAKGIHRYSRSPSRIIGRCTGSPIDAPNNLVLTLPQPPEKSDG